MKVMASTKIYDLDEILFSHHIPLMTPEQCRAARAWLNWPQDALAKAASVGVSTVRDFEAGRREPTRNNLAAMRAVLEAEGLSFVDDAKTCGIIFSKGKTQ
ncbi:helix-turn-helix domain-containing protein [Nitrobacter sp. TKz-YC02]|uniref:helix-turn-helix domain-containing protein n=1 Tax=Nitrobacter sp. TKz-YC02 TaxID=3398704 RepID=UPI003CE75A4A